MTKTDFIRKVSKKTKTTQKTVTAVLEAFTEAVYLALKSKYKITLRGFGTFSTSTKTTLVKRKVRDVKLVITTRKILPTFTFSQKVKKTLR